MCEIGVHQYHNSNRAVCDSGDLHGLVQSGRGQDIQVGGGSKGKESHEFQMIRYNVRGGNQKFPELLKKII